MYYDIKSVGGLYHRVRVEKDGEPVTGAVFFIKSCGRTEVCREAEGTPGLYELPPCAVGHHHYDFVVSGRCLLWGLLRVRPSALPEGAAVTEQALRLTEDSGGEIHVVLSGENEALYRVAMSQGAEDNYTAGGFVYRMPLRGRISGLRCWCRSGGGTPESGRIRAEIWRGGEKLRESREAVEHAHDAELVYSFPPVDAAAGDELSVFWVSETGERIQACVRVARVDNSAGCGMLNASGSVQSRDWVPKGVWELRRSVYVTVEELPGVTAVRV